MIKAIIFDFGEVLNAPPDEEQDAQLRRRLAGMLDLPPDELWPYLFECEASRLWMTGQLDWDGFWNAVLPPRGITEPEAIRAFTDEVFENHNLLHPEMVGILKGLVGSYKLALLSNSSKTEEEMARILYHDLGLPSGIFDTIVTSTTVGAVKPDAAIFEEALDRLNVAPEEALFTDDMVSFTEAAREMGMYAHTFSTPAEFRTYLESQGIFVEPQS